MNGAEILLFLVRWFFEHEDQPYMPDLANDFHVEFERRFGLDVDCEYTTLSQIISSSAARKTLRWTSESATDTVMAPFAHCSARPPRGRFHTIRWHIRGSQPLPSRQVAMKTAGFVTLLHMVVSQRGPDPISPWILRYVIKGMMGACTIDHAFMQLLDGNLYKTLAPWLDHDRNALLPTNPQDKLYMLLTAAEIDTECFGKPPFPEELLWLELGLVAQTVFGVSKVEHNADLKAFTHGLLCALAPGSLSQAAHSAFMDDQSWDLVYQCYFHKRLEEYLNGIGHPDHPNVHAVIGEVRFLADANDPLLRTRLFLQMITGSAWQKSTVASGFHIMTEGTPVASAEQVIDKVYQYLYEYLPSYLMQEVVSPPIYGTVLGAQVPSRHFPALFRCRRRHALRPRQTRQPPLPPAPIIRRPPAAVPDVEHDVPAPWGQFSSVLHPPRPDHAQTPSLSAQRSSPHSPWQRPTASRPSSPRRRRAHHLPAAAAPIAPRRRRAQHQPPPPAAVPDVELDLPDPFGHLAPVPRGLIVTPLDAQSPAFKAAIPPPAIAVIAHVARRIPLSRLSTALYRSLPFPSSYRVFFSPVFKIAETGLGTVCHDRGKSTGHSRSLVRPRCDVIVPAHCDIRVV
ncbi:hypothetical protein C8Q76DRAFT_688012 [Earliella scabrosa]|nr:hypothetical protein C8Q76DRAFT_688012 [Earliella scabrosa]